MASAVVRIGLGAHGVLRDIAKRTGRSMQEVLDEAVERYRREQFLREVNAGYARLREAPETWRVAQREMRAWEATLADGLSPWTGHEGVVVPPRTRAQRKPKARKGRG